MDSGTRVRRRLATRALMATGVLLVLATLSAPPGVGAASLTASATPPVRLLHQTPVLDGAGSLLGLSLTRTGPAAAVGATVQVTLYQRLTTRSALLASITSPGPVGPVSTTTPVAASCLTSGAQLRVALAVAPDGATVGRRQLCGATAPVLRLGCSGGCDGVYPLRVTVVGGGTSSSILSLVTVASTSTTPLRVAWVVRVAGLPGDTGALAAAQSALRGVAAHPLVPVTVDVEGSAIANGATQPGATAALSLLHTVTTDTSDELVNEPYVNANLGALRASELGTEVTRQYALDQVVLLQHGIDAAPSSSVTFATGPITPTAADASASVGYHRLIVPGSALSLDPASTLTWGDAFKVAGAPGGPSLLATDTQLSAMSEATSADPGLVAAQVLGELAFLHFEQPDLVEPRVVVVATTATDEVTTAFVDSVLEGLSHNPVLTPVSASDAFRHVPVGANGFPAVRSLALAPSGPFAQSTISELRHLRITTDALSSAISGPATPIPSIEGELLSAEQPLPAAERNRIMDEVQDRLQAELGNFRIYDGNITLTESGASLPITVLSTAPYTVTGTLELSSPRLDFPQGSRVQDFKLPIGGVNSTRIAARAIVNGDIPLTVHFVSPDGRLLLAHAVITVRVTRFSVVGVLLTGLAALTLAAWWIRTSRRRRRAAR